MQLFRLRLSAALLTFGLAASPGWATNGYFSHGTSTAEKGLAGAGVAYSQDTLAAANNPAGMAWQGSRYDVGATLFMPMRSYSAENAPSFPAGSTCDTTVIGGPCPFSIGDGDQSVDSENELFLIPSFGYNRELADGASIGFSVYGNGGMNTQYKGGLAIVPVGTSPTTFNMTSLDGTYGDGTAGVDLSQLFISTTYSRKISETTAWGVSGIVAYQRFEARGLANFGGFSLDPSSLSNNGHDSATGIGVRVGLQTLLAPTIRFGIAYQPKIDMSEFDDYSGLFAEDGDFDIPSNLTVGVAINVGQSGVVLLEAQQINYEDVAAVSNPIANLVPSNGQCAPGPTGGSGDGCLGGDDGAGFGWEDMTVLKLGYQWRDADWTWRVGVSTTDQPIPDEEVLFNILAPGVMEQHLTFGFTRQIDADSAFTFAAMYAPSVSVSGDNTFDPAQEIELEMDQYELVFSYNRRL